MGDPNTHIQDCVAVELYNDRAAINDLIESILKNAATAGLKDAAIFAVRLAIEEAITNAFVHGHRDVPSNIPVLVEYKISDGIIEVAIEDHGPGFTPDALPDPTLIENLSKPFGRGVMLMKAYMTEVSFNPKGNRVRLRYIVPST